MGEMRNSYKILVGRPKERRPVGRPRHITKMDLEGTGCEDIE
jgi:hypothetical protein